MGKRSANMDGQYLLQGHSLGNGILVTWLQSCPLYKGNSLHQRLTCLSAKHLGSGVMNSDESTAIPCEP